MKKILYWTPRVLGIVLGLFIGIFALDVFGTGQGFWRELGGFIIHLTPTWVILISLTIAWRWERLGGVLFILAGALMWVIFSAPGGIFIAIFAILLALVGVMFLASGWQQAKRAR
jgi:hypothetical protein